MMRHCAVKQRALCGLLGLWQIRWDREPERRLIVIRKIGFVRHRQQPTDGEDRRDNEKRDTEVPCWPRIGNENGCDADPNCNDERESLFVDQLMDNAQPPVKQYLKISPYLIHAYPHPVDT